MVSAATFSDPPKWATIASILHNPSSPSSKQGVVWSSLFSPNQHSFPSSPHVTASLSYWDFLRTKLGISTKIYTHDLNWNSPTLCWIISNPVYLHLRGHEWKIFLSYEAKRGIYSSLFETSTLPFSIFLFYKNKNVLVFNSVPKWLQENK